MTVTHERTTRFEDVYARAPFSELIRLVLKAAQASQTLVTKLAHRHPTAALPAAEH